MEEKYERGRVLGEGTFGQVYEAYRRKDQLKVAIKRLKGNDPNGGIDRTVLREIKFLQELHEPNIIKLIEVYVVDGNVHLVLEFCAYDLEKIIRDKTILLQTSQIKLYMKMLLESINQCHRSYIIHRDLKPANLLFDMQGNLKLSDFGLARNFGSPVAMTSEVQTLWYRPAELLFGSNFYSSSIDMWAAGCIFAEMILRVPLFQGETDIDQLSKIFNVVGTPNEENWPNAKTLPKFIRFEHRDPMDLRPLFSSKIVNTNHANDSTSRNERGTPLDLLLKLLTLDPMKRLTAEQALQHKYFRTEPLPCTQSELPIPASVSVPK